MYFEEDLIERIKESNNIVDIISESVKLKKVGNNYQGLCPFHSEKTPSFSVSTEKQMYKCFGCGEGGNVITFVMKNNNLDFKEALTFLADRANIELQNVSKEKQEYYNKRKLLYQINTEAARYFFSNLEKNNRVREYLKKRGVNQNSIRSYGLGYSNDSWNELLDYLKEKGFKESDLILAGVVTKNDKGNIYDRFRNRVMFPVFDHRGKVIAFGARVIDDSKPKYLNSPETPIFDKGINLYGLNFTLKDRSNRNKKVILVEGYMDFIGLRQRGILNVVATLGTALTKDQAKLIKRYNDTVYISFDSDEAGQKATLRSLDILKDADLEVFIINIPKGMDPDDYIKKHGKDAYINLIDNAYSLIDYKLHIIKEKENLTDDQGKINYVKNAVDVLKTLNPIERDVYIRKISSETEISESAIQSMLGMKSYQNSKSNYKNTNTSGRKNMSSKQRNFRPAKENINQIFLERGYVKAGRGLLRILAYNRDELSYEIKEKDFINTSHKNIFRLIDNYEGDPGKIVSYVESKCDDVTMSKEWTIITKNTEIPDLDIDVLARDFKETLEYYKKIGSQKKLMDEIKKLEQEGKLDDSLKLAAELIDLQKNLGR